MGRSNRQRKVSFEQSYFHLSALEPAPAT
jgi:hypothetical protein